MELRIYLEFYNYQIENAGINGYVNVIDRHPLLNIIK